MTGNGGFKCRFAEGTVPCDLVFDVRRGEKVFRRAPRGNAGFVTVPGSKHRADGVG